MRFSGRAPQLIGTSGMSARRLWSCRARATSSLPVPVSPQIKTVEFVGATLAIMRRTASIGGDVADQLRGAFQAFESLLEGPILVGQFAFFGHPPQHRGEIGQLARLGEVVEGPVAERGHGRFQRRLAGEDHRFGVGGELLGPGDDLQPVGSRHIEIDQEAIVDVAFQGRQGRRSVRTDGHLVAHPRQFQPHQFLERSLVIGKEEFEFRARFRGVMWS